MAFSWMELAQEYAKEHLPELCKEIVEWKHTGLLYGGEGGLLREMASRMPVEFGQAERIAESIVVDIVLEERANE